MSETVLSIVRLILCIIGINALMFVTFVVGVIGHGLYWLLFDSFGREEARLKRKLKRADTSVDENQYYALIVGSGFSGLGMAIRLRELGVENFVIVERDHRLGGTWYANKYPGCACDVPSHLYSFSFEPNPRWSYHYSRQPEIGQYLEDCADKYDVRRFIKFNEKVIRADWIDDQQIWRVTVESEGTEKKYEARFFFGAQGPLANPSFPKDIPGIEKFKGDMFHTAEWKTNVDFHNKTVAVVGTGASAIQVIPSVHQYDLKKLLVFQRTPAWVIPRADRKITNLEKWLFTKFPILQKIIRACMYWMRESTVLSFTHRLPTRYLLDELNRYNIKYQVKDPELRKKLTPNFDVGCKRVLVSDDWFNTIQKPNVELVTDRIREVTENCIITKDGVEHRIDIIIWSTGFQVQNIPFPIYGRNKIDISEHWAEIMRAHRGVTVPNFPNLFLLLGPNSGLGHNSVLLMLEAQIQYIAEMLLIAEQKNARSFEVKAKACEDFNRSIQSDLKKTVWQSGGCRSWYQDAKGNNTTIWPGFTWTYILFMKNCDPENYIFL